jgi:hypothetical protein
LIPTQLSVRFVHSIGAKQHHQQPRGQQQAHHLVSTRLSSQGDCWQALHIKTACNRVEKKKQWV